MTLRVKNWERFQHFKDRRPPWIKLYRDLLDDIEWHHLDSGSAKVLVMLWLIASEDQQRQGTLPGVAELAFRLRIPEKQLNLHLTKLSHWLFQDDIKAISEGYQSDRPETETETETETERVAKKTPQPFVLPKSISTETWRAFEEHRKKLRKPMTDTARSLIVSKMQKIGGDPNAILEESICNGWQGVFAPRDNGPGEKRKERKCDFETCTDLGKNQHYGHHYCKLHLPL